MEMHLLLFCLGWILVLCILIPIRCQDLWGPVCQPHLPYRSCAKAEGILDYIRVGQNKNASATEMVAPAANMMLAD